MFVVSNEAETRYIAANTTGEMGEKFLTRWVDEDNQTVNSCLEFAKSRLEYTNGSSDDWTVFCD